MTADDLLKRRKGSAFNAEEALAARQILARSATDLVNMAKKFARIDNPGDELEASFKEAWLRHVAIQEQVAGMTAEAGRALAQFRQVADGRLASRAIPALGDIAGGTGRLKDVAGRIVDLENQGVGPGGVNSYALRALKPRWQDKAIELYINGLLSKPTTHAVNMLSNTMTALMQITDQPVFAVAGFWQRTKDGNGFTMVTCDPNELVAPIHPKAMITVLAPEDQEAWLTCPLDDVAQFQRPYPADRMTVRGPIFPTRELANYEKPGL